MVIVVIGLLSYAGISLFTSQSNYTNAVAKDLVISHSLLAQQASLGGANTVQLEIAVNGDDNWEFSVSKVGLTGPETIVVESSGNQLRVDGTLLSSGDSEVFTWNTASVLTSGSNHEVRFSGQNDYRVCLSSQGYAYESSVACP